MLVQLATESQSAISLLELVPDERSFNKVCWLLLDALECRGKLRSSESAIVASCVCSPLTSMQNLGSWPMFGVGPNRWPDGPPQSGVAHGFGLIPVSGVGVVVDGEKTRGNGAEGTCNKDRTKDEMTFPDTQRIVRPLSQTYDHMWSAQRERVRVCAFGEVLAAHPSVAFMAVATVWTRNCQKEKMWGMRKTANWIRTQVGFDNNRHLFARQQFPEVSLSVNLSLSFLRFVSHHSLSCHSWECHSCHWWSQDEELHVEDEDDEKYFFQLKLNHSKCCCTAGSNVLFCLVLKCIGKWSTPLSWARWRLTRASFDDFLTGRWHSGRSCSLESTPLM